MLNNPTVSAGISPLFGDVSCNSLMVNGVPVTGSLAGSHTMFPPGAIQTNSPVTLNNSTWTQLTNTGPLAASLFFNGTRLVLDLNGYITVGTPTAMDVIDVYCTYTKNGGSPVGLTTGSQISNACYSGCSCRVSGVTTDSFAVGDTLALQIYAKCQVASTLAVGTQSATWIGTMAYY